MDKIQNYGESLFVGMYRRIIIPGFLRWCRIASIHSIFLAGLLAGRKCESRAAETIKRRPAPPKLERALCASSFNRKSLSHRTWGSCAGSNWDRPKLGPVHLTPRWRSGLQRAKGPGDPGCAPVTSKYPLFSGYHVDPLLKKEECTMENQAFHKIPPKYPEKYQKKTHPYAPKIGCPGKWTMD